MNIIFVLFFLFFLYFLIIFVLRILINFKNMFTLYQSNNLNILKENMLYIIKKNKINNIFFCNNFILVPNNNVSLNIKIFLAKKLGICANFKFLLLNNFILKIYKIIIPNIYKNNYFNKNNLLLIIFNILPKLIKLNEFLIIKKYLNYDYSYEKLFYLSIKISNIFFKYLIYRLDWLYKWENYKYVKNINNFIHQKWQSILWREIKKFISNKFLFNFNKFNIYFEFCNKLKKKNFIFPKNIINNINIFNISYIPPIYINILYLISKYINVNYFLFNPCYKIWYKNIFFNNKKSNFKCYKEYKSFNNKNNYNFILLNYGKSFSKHLLLLSKLNIKKINYFIDIKRNNKLNIIKNNVLHFNNNFSKIKDDNSIIINKSNGYMEEIKKLKNFLFDLIINKNYNVNDIIVNVTDINLYSIYIESIFSNKFCKKYLPFKILENNNFYNNELLNIFLNLLNIYNLEFNLVELLCFFKKKVIFKKFNINYEELKVILYIIKNIGLNINLNEKLNKNITNKFNYLTLINWLKRILLGYCIDNEYYIWNNIIPYSYLSNNFYYDLIEKILKFFDKILFWKNILNKKYLFSDWIFICIKFINNFFYKKYLNKSCFLNKNIFFSILKKYKIYFSNKYLDINIFKKILIYFLKCKKKKKIYSIDCINFCSFNYSESLFFKVICLIGMNENIYLKNKIYCNFDLIYYNWRIGDYDKNNNNKYLFLQKILFSNKLYISYINFSFIDNNFNFPSILLIFLKNYISIFIDKNFLYRKKKNNFIFLKKNIYNIKKYNLNISNYINKNKYFNILNNKYIINLFNLHNFWLNPIKYFFIYYHGINYFIDNIYINKNENFDLNIKNFYLFKFKIIDILIKYGNINNIYLYLKYLNLFPINNFGKILWNKEKKNIFNLVENIKNFYLKIKKIKIKCIINNYIIKGYIYKNNNLGLFKWLPKKLNLIDALLLWIDHLLYCYMGGNKCSYLYGYNSIWCFLPIDKYKCIKYINKYINGYLNSFNYPVFFLPKSSNIWIFSAYNIKYKFLLNKYFIEKAKEKLFNSLYGNFFIKGELYDIYISYIIKKYYNFLNINFIIQEIEKWLLPVFNNLIIK